MRRFQLVRSVQLEDAGPEIDVQVDFLMPRDVEIAKNDPPLVKDFAAQKADGAALALRFKEFVAIEGDMPDGGGRNRVQIAVATIPALLAMKGFAIANRKKAKDAYDIYYCVRNYPGGLEALALACQPIIETEEGREGYDHIADKFSDFEQFGPVQVRKFVEGSQTLGGRTPEQWQRDAFGQVSAWLREMNLDK